MRHHNDADFGRLEETVKKQEEHLEANDKNSLDNKERIDKIETIGQCFMWIGGFVGFGGVAAFLQKKKGSA